MVVRCAIYTRKSTDEGLEQDFNSLDAQRESSESYVASQKNEGWVALPDRYDDGGYSGGNTDRPAFQRLMTDVREGKVDAIIIYKIDRLSRSLMDFAGIMEALDSHNVALVSVTQQFNTTTSMGRLTLNILLSFAQFEREIISERTRDKIGAMRRKGKHWGGKPILGYDIVRPPESPGGSRLVVNPEEAERVRQLFEMYRQSEGLIAVVEEAQRLGWVNKVWTTKAGKERGGGTIDKSILWRILTNVTYIGKVAYAGQVYEGEHDAIISPELWQAVQAILTRNGRCGGHGPGCVRRDDALLRGLLTCKACGCAMMPTYTVKNTVTGGRKRYRYYVCHRATKRGRKQCPCPTLPAHEIEQFVVNELIAIGRDPVLRDRVLTETEKRLANSTVSKQKNHLDRRAASEALSEFEPLWKVMSPNEQRRLIQLLIQEVAYDAENSRVAITFQPTGIALLAADDAPADNPDEHTIEEAAA